MTDRQAQRARDHAVQVQVQGDYVVHGVTEDRAREIALAAARRVVDEYTAEAAPVAGVRADQFAEIVVERLAQRGQLGAFADPAFHHLLMKAQRAAVGVGEDDAYEILTNLLSERAQDEHDRTRWGAIDRAVEIAELVDQQALAGLTVATAVTILRPTNGLVVRGLDLMEMLFQDIVVEGLPTGEDWLERLDTLRAVRLLPRAFGGRKDLAAILADECEGYVSSGFQPDEEEQLTAAAGLSRPAPIVDHELRPGHRRLAFASREEARAGLEVAGIAGEALERVMAALEEHGKLGTQHADAVKALGDEIEKRPAMASAAAWWRQDIGERGFEITKSGRMLALVNAMRLDTGGRIPRELLT